MRNYLFILRYELDGAVQTWTVARRKFRGSGVSALSVQHWNKGKLPSYVMCVTINQSFTTESQMMWSVPFRVKSLD